MVSLLRIDPQPTHRLRPSSKSATWSDWTLTISPAFAWWWTWYTKSSWRNVNTRANGQTYQGLLRIINLWSASSSSSSLASLFSPLSFSSLVLLVLIYSCMLCVRDVINRGAINERAQIKEERIYHRFWCVVWGDEWWWSCVDDRRTMLVLQSLQELDARYRREQGPCHGSTAAFLLCTQHTLLMLFLHPSLMNDTLPITQDPTHLDAVKLLH